MQYTAQDHCSDLRMKLLRRIGTKA